MNKFSVLILVVTAMAWSASSNAAYQSQTLIRYSNGLIQTLPAVTVPEYLIYAPGQKTPTKISNAALLYDKRNPLPPLTVMGANYGFMANGTMVTVSESGSLYYKGKIPYQPSLNGGNYFINKGTNELITIDSEGYFNATGKIATNLRILGGNFYIDQAGIMTTIKHSGMAPGNPLGQVTQKDGWNFNDVVKAGGNFMVKTDGTIIAIDSQTGFFSDPQKVDSYPMQLGGNYFIGQDRILYTVSSKGQVQKWQLVNGEMKTFGYSYMIDQDGDFIFVDGEGIPHTSLVNVSTTGIESKVVTRITNKIDQYLSFTRRTE
jgi:hypothetical protein